MDQPGIVELRQVSTDRHTRHTEVLREFVDIDLPGRLKHADDLSLPNFGR